MKGLLPRTLSGIFHLAFLLLVIPLVLAIAAGSADRESIAAIHEAAESGDLAAVRELLEADADLLEARTEAGDTPLNTASEAGMLEIVKYLVAEGADLEAGDNENTAPLAVAAIGGHADVIEFLTAQGADPLAADDNGATALTWAAFSGQLEIVKMMVDLGADVNTLKANGSNALIGAAYGGHTETVRYLIAQGSELDVQNQYGYTALMLAVLRGHAETARVLLDEGADMAIWADWQSIAHFAAISGDPETMELVLSRGADPNAHLEDLASPIIMAIDTGNPEMVEILFRHGCDGSPGWESGYTALHRAVQVGNVDIVRSLISRGLDVNSVNDDRISPLDNAIAVGGAEIAGILIKNGAEVNTVDPHFGKTPLHAAAAAGNVEIVGLLLANGVKTNEKDAEGYTALDLAARYGHKDVAELLSARGAKPNRKIENYGRCGLLSKSLNESEAILWYTGHCGWAVKTRNRLLIFDYWNQGTDPTNPSLANGHINPEEIGDLDVTVFVTHEHRDHFDTTIFDWENRVDHIRYVYGFRPEETPDYRRTGYNGPAYEYIGPRESKTLDGMKISTIAANDAGLGFLIQVDGITLYHAGDHAGWAEGEKQGYLDEIDYLAGFAGEIDLAFLNVTGCHAHNPDALREGTYYTLDKLSPRVVIPTHASTREFQYLKAAEKAAEDGITTAYACPRCRGDRFLYSEGKVRLDMRDSSS